MARLPRYVLPGHPQHNVQYFNYSYRRTGTLWEGRYRATLIDSERYLLTCYRYIEENPVRANMVSHPAMYRWSSFLCNARGVFDELISSHSLYRALASTDSARAAAYDGLFKHKVTPELLDVIRCATNKAWVLGDDRFKEEIEKFIDRRLDRLPTGGDRRSVEFNSSD